MKISERAEAARSAYQDALQTHKGFMNGFRAFSSAVKCFCSSRAVRNWQEKNMPTVSRAATDQETEGAGDTTIRERTVVPLGAAENVEPDIATPKDTEGQTESTDDKSPNKPGLVESDSATPKDTEGQTESTDDKSPNKPSLVESDITTPKDTEDQTESTDDKSSGEPKLLDNSIAKRRARPKNRRPPTRTNRQ